MRTEKLDDSETCPACGGPLWRITATTGHASVICGTACTWASVPGTVATVGTVGTVSAEPAE